MEKSLNLLNDLESAELNQADAARANGGSVSTPAMVYIRRSHWAGHGQVTKPVAPAATIGLSWCARRA
jgi:hypothetical protein